MIKTEILVSDALRILREKFFLAASKIVLILIVSMITSVCITIIFALLPVRYTAKTSLINENTTVDKLGTYASLAELAGIEIPSSNVNAYDGENLMEFIKSSFILKKALLSKYNGSTFLDIYLKNNKILFLEVSKNGRYIENRINDSICNKVIVNIQKNLSVKKINKKNDVITIAYVDVNEDFTFNFLHSILQNTETNYKNYKYFKNFYKVALLQEQVDSLKKLIFNKYITIANELDNNIAVIKNKAKSKAEQQQQSLQSNNSLYTELLKNLQIAKINLLSEKPFLHIIDQSTLPLENNEKKTVFVFFASLLTFTVVLFIFYFLKYLFE